MYIYSPSLLGNGPQGNFVNISTMVPALLQTVFLPCQCLHRLCQQDEWSQVGKEQDDMSRVGHEQWAVLFVGRKPGWEHSLVITAPLGQPWPTYNEGQRVHLCKTEHPNLVEKESLRNMLNIQIQSVTHTDLASARGGEGIKLCIFNNQPSVFQDQILQIIRPCDSVQTFKGNWLP